MKVNRVTEDTKWSPEVALSCLLWNFIWYSSDDDVSPENPITREGQKSQDERIRNDEDNGTTS